MNITILSGIPLGMPTDEVLDIQVLMTMVGGEAVYCNKATSAVCP